MVDKRISFVGSYNLDPRSDIYNELGIVLYDANFSEKLMKSINRDMIRIILFNSEQEGQTNVKFY